MAIKKGLRRGPPRFDSHKHTFQTLQEFLVFAEGYAKGEEDEMEGAGVAFRRVTSHFSDGGEPSRRKPKGHKPAPRNNNPRNDNNPRSSNNHRGDGRPQFHGVTGERYKPAYQTLTPLTLSRDMIFLRIRNHPDLKYPRPLEICSMKNEEKFCEFQDFQGHDTRECLHLRDELERLVRL